MNLKEAFRYQRYLESLFHCADSMLREHAMKVTKTHLKNSANPDEENVTEVVRDCEFDIGDVVEFILSLIDEKERLAESISYAKRYHLYKVNDLDAALEVNKFRKSVAETLKAMLSYKESVTSANGVGYKFNADGVQSPYYYTIVTSSEYNFDKNVVKTGKKLLTEEMDDMSVKIEYSLVSTEVDYTPPYDVNGSFEDAMEIFIANKNAGDEPCESETN